MAVPVSCRRCGSPMVERVVDSVVVARCVKCAAMLPMAVQASSQVTGEGTQRIVAGQRAASTLTSS